MTRIITFIVILVIFLGFIVLNLEHVCDISFGFITLEKTPIFLSVLVSFTLGMFVTIPLFLTRKKPKKPELDKPPKKGELDDSKKGDVAQDIDGLKKENSPYGID